jgi:hypothetical protein
MKKVLMGKSLLSTIPLKRMRNKNEAKRTKNQNTMNYVI